MLRGKTWTLKQNAISPIERRTMNIESAKEVQTPILARVIDTCHEANVMEGTLTWQRKMENMTNIKPLKALYNVVRVQQNTKMCKILKCNRVTFYLSAFVKILQKDVNKDQKRHNTNKIDSTSHEKSFETTKLIPEPETTKLKSKKLNGMCLKQNLENRMSQNISLGVQNRTCDFDRKNRPPNNIKIQINCTIMMGSESTFWRFFWLEKRSSDEQVMAKKPHVGQKKNYF